MRRLGGVACLVAVSALLTHCRPEMRSGAFHCETATDCDSGRVCESGWCVVAGAECVDLADGESCDDGLFCTTNDVCAAGSCVGSGDPCAANPCETATCDETADACGAGTCGDSICCGASGEDASTCVVDCTPVCGDDSCTGGETVVTCPADCSVCGDGSCTGPEDGIACSEDCSLTCGDGTCDPTEDNCNCPVDCGASICSDTICCVGDGEDSCTCTYDCGDDCGDGCCSGTETACTCPGDCNADVCGDGCCTGTEDPCTCPAECTSNSCGDGCCSGAEDKCGCPGDCTADTCADGCCTGTEDKCGCPTDCTADSCGDGCCTATETKCGCPGDCTADICGDGCCTGSEDKCACPGDCTNDVCSDGCCTGSESFGTCPADCAAGCPDGSCNGSEDKCSCPADCATDVCGDGCCTGTEDKCGCPAECTADNCGDGCCTGSEDKCGCPADCTTDVCGDGCCTGTEDKCGCPADCTVDVCGDGCCTGSEDICSCAAECTVDSCGDGCCTGTETKCNCPGDCTGVCLGDDGQGCTVNGDCFNTCISGSCAPVSGNGGTCDDTLDCVANNTCVAGVCLVTSPPPEAVHSIGTAGRDFLTMQAWEDARQGDLTNRNMFTTSAQTGAFSAGETITGSISGATGIYVKERDTPGASEINMSLDSVVGTFVAAETLTGGASAATATLATIVSSTGTVEKGEMYNDSVFTGLVAIDGSTVDASHYMHLTVAASDRHIGIAGTGVVIDPTVDGIPIEIRDPFTRVGWIEITDFTSSASVSLGVLSAAAVVVISHLIIHDYGSSTWDYALRVSGTTASATVMNSVVYNSDSVGFHVRGEGVLRLYNCTSYNHTLSPVKISSSGGTITAKNVIAVGASSDDFSGSQYSPGYVNSEYLISTDGTATSIDATNSISGVVPVDLFRDITLGSEDLHLKSGTAAIGTGIDLSGIFTTDIDGDTRLLPWDIGADEHAVGPPPGPSPPSNGIYRSVGPWNTVALASGSANGLSIAGTTATFAAGLPGNTGVGDVIQYDSDDDGSVDAVAFIHERTSATVYTVASASGAAPAPTSATDNDWSLFRAYTSLFDAERGTENSGIDAGLRNFDTWSGGRDLIADNKIWFIACYGDATDTTAVLIDGWTSASANYLKIFTPAYSNQVGTSQRHAGVWDGAKYVFAPPAAANAIQILDSFIRFEGLQILVPDDGDGLHITWDTLPDGYEFHISHNIFTSATNRGRGVRIDEYFGEVHIWNNIAYGFSVPRSDGDSYCFSIVNNTYFFYNNTMVNCQFGVRLGDGLNRNYFKNNIAVGCSPGNCFYLATTFTESQTINNVSSDGSAPGVGSQTFVTPVFVNPAGNDYHLDPTDTIAIDSGVDLSADPKHAFSDDVDIQTRPAGAWDVGADQAN